MQEKQPVFKRKKLKILILSTFTLVVLLIFTFGCYGCSYQPITPPDPEEALAVSSLLVGTSWILDEAEGPQEGLEEFHTIPLETLQFNENKPSQEGTLSLLVKFRGEPPLSATLSYQNKEGFSLTIENTPYPVSVVYSQSKNGKTETLTLKGQKSNIQCYYLKK